MLNAHLETRLTRRYVGTCAHLDQWASVGVVKTTPARMVREPRDFDDGGVYLRWVIVPAHMARNLRPEVIRRAIEDTLTSEGCHHEYDCCGCASVRAQARRVDRRRWVVRESISYNY